MAMICSMVVLRTAPWSVRVHLAEVHVHPEEVAAFARDQQDAAAGAGLDGALGADVREVGDGEDVHDAPGVVGLVAGQVAADRLADFAARSVCTHDVLGADDALLALVRAGGVEQCDSDGVVALAGDLEAAELVAVVGGHAGGGIRHELGEVVQHAGLVDDQVRELADAHFVVDGAGGADDAGVVRRVRLPERHLGDPVRLRGDPLGEAEGLEGLDAAGLDAVGLADGEPAGAALNDAGGDVGELGKLRGGEHACRPGADDEHVHFVGKLSRAGRCRRRRPAGPAGHRIRSRGGGTARDVLTSLCGWVSPISCSIIEFYVR